MNRGVAAARSAVVSPTLAVIFLVALPFYMSKLVAAPSVCEYKVLIPLECLSQLCVKVLVEQARHLLSSLWWHCLFTCNKLVVDLQFASRGGSSCAFCMQQFGCGNLSLRIQRFLCLLSFFLNSVEKARLNRGVAAARSAAVSPTLAVIFLVALPFYIQQIGCRPSVCKSSCAFRFTCYPGFQDTYEVFWGSARGAQVREVVVKINA